MIPVSLTIEGLYSYQKPQTIDFEKLTSNQLFGIFGSVGSGKSSILEAIMFVLYGETDRLNSRGDNRYYNMLNLKSDRLFIEFTCKAGKQNRELFRFSFEAKRKKEFEKVESPNNGRKAYQKVGGKWQALENWSTDEILGMNYRNFKTTTIIPQGKFREFIEQTPSHRTTMLQEIFQLDQYDLSDRTNRLQSLNNAALNKAQGRFEQFVAVTEEALTETEKAKQQQQSDLQIVQKELVAKEQKWKRLQQLQELSEKLALAQQQMVSLERQAEEMLEKERELKEYQKVYEQFHDPVVRLHELRKTEKDKEAFVAGKEKELQAVSSALTSAQREKENWEQKYQNRDTDQRKCQELEVAIERFDLVAELDTVSRDLAARQASFSEVNQKMEADQQKLKDLDQQLTDLKKERKDLSLLHEVKQWFDGEKRLISELEELQKSLEKDRKAMEELEKQKAAFLQKQGLSRLSALPFSEILQELQQQVEKHKAQLQLQQERINQLKVQKEVADLRMSLIDGEPCPVCGSEHHPGMKSGEHDDLDQELAILEKQQKTRESSLDELEVDLKAVDKIAYQFGSVRVKFEESEYKLEGKEEEIAQYKKRFFYKDFSTNDRQKVEDEIKAQALKEQEIGKKEQEVTSLRKASDESRGKKEKLAEALNDKKGQLATLQARVNDREKSIQLLELEKLEKYSRQQLEESLAKGKRQLEELEQSFKAATEKVNKLSLQQVELTSDMANGQRELIQLARQMEELDNEVKGKLQQSEFENLNTVRGILGKRLNTAEIQQEIEAFKLKHTSAQATINTLKEQIGEQAFSLQELQTLGREVEELTQRKEAMAREVAVLGTKADELKQKLIEKAKVQKELTQLTDRQENLSVMARLFRGRGFVEFVSAVYLRNLVEAANQRFMRLTRNNLSLELNDSNDFIVRDYLNNGKTRLLKTLSGGQTFQAALCLALALAENVKSLNQADQSFFFLDEGFGTLDRKSLQVVFETLKSLRKENRIVGVISHVEELQQEIEVFLRIENDKEEGSLVMESWR